MNSSGGDMEKFIINGEEFTQEDAWKRVMDLLDNIDRKIQAMSIQQPSPSILPRCNCYTNSTAACPIHTIPGGLTASEAARETWPEDWKQTITPENN